MAGLNIPQAAPQAPSFGSQAGASPALAPAQAAPQAQAQDVEVHKTVKAIDDRLMSAPREAQQFVTQAIASIKALPTLMGILIGPEAQDYFTGMQQKIAASTQAQPNSADTATPAMAPASANPSPDASQGAPAGGSPAMATPTPAPSA